MKIKYNSDGNIIEIENNSFKWFMIGLGIMFLGLCIGIGISKGF